MSTSSCFLLYWSCERDGLFQRLKSTRWQWSMGWFSSEFLWQQRSSDGTRILYLRWFSRRGPGRSFLSLSFSIYCQTLLRVLSAGVLCTLRVAGWKPTSNHISITVGFFNLHRGWLSLYRGHPANIPIRSTMHLSSIIPANDTRESVFGHWNFPRRGRGSNLGPPAPEVSA